jgi:hypothetical protein
VKWYRKFSLIVSIAVMGALLASASPAQAQFSLGNPFKDPANAGAAATTSAADFKAVVDDIKGGKVAVGATAFVVVLFKNRGVSSVKVGNVNLYPSSTVSAQVTLNQCADAPLTTDAQCAITLAVKGLQSGAWRVEVLVDHSGPSRITMASITGEVEQVATQKDDNKGDVEISPVSLDFGTSPGGIALVRSVVLNNRSAEAITVKGITLEGPDKSGFTFKSQCPETLQPGETCNIIVTWQPTTKGLAQGVLVVQHTGKTGMAQSEVKGVLQPPEVVAKETGGDLDASPALLDFGISPGGIALVRSVILNNRSAEIIKIKGIILNAPDQSGYTFKSQCPEAMQPGETCNVIVSWLPTTKGLAQGVLAVQHSGKSGMVQSELKGVFQPPSMEDTSNGAAGKVVAFPAVLDFGTSAGGLALKRSVVLSNHTQEMISINNISLDVPEKSGFSHKSQCPETLHPEESCNIVVTWLPTSGGLAQGVLVIQHSGRSGLTQTEVKGMLQLPPTAEKPKDVTGSVELSPDNLDFGTSTGGIALKRAMVLANHTAGDVDIWDIGLNVPEQSGFSYDSQCPETLRPEENCNIIVTWQPTSKGLAQGVLAVQHSGKTGVAQAEVKGNLQLTGEAAKIDAGRVEASPASMDFGTSSGDMPLVRSILINNHSMTTVNIQGVTLSAPDQAGFSYKSQCPASLPPEGGCNVIVTWKPTSKGLAQGVLAVQHSGKGGLVQTDLRGTFQSTGEAAKDTGKVEASPASIDFGVSGGGIPLIRSFIITNHSSTGVTLQGVTLNTPDQSGFSYKSQCPDMLPPEGACNIIVTWLPTIKGTAQGVLAVQHSGKGGLVQTDLKGVYQSSGDKSKDEGKLEVSPSSLDFGTSNGGIALKRAMLVSNHSFEPVTIKEIALDVPDQSGYSYKSECPQTLQPDENCSVVVTWLPTSKGLAQGVLGVKHSGKGGVAQAELRGVYQSTGDAAKDVGRVEISPASLDFGTSSGGIALKRAVLVSNHLMQTVTIKDLTLDVPDQSGYSYKSQCPQTLQPEENCSIIVTWQPTSKGLAQGILAVQHSGKGGLVQTELRGTFQSTGDKTKDEGRVEASPTSMDFGTSSGGIALVRSLAVSNRTLESIKIEGVTLNAPDQSGFSYKSQCPETLPPEGVCNVIVTWLPTSKGLAQGVLAVQHSGKGGLVQTELRGVFQSIGTTAKDEGKMEVTPETLDFGTSSGGIALKRAVMVSNHSLQPVTIKDLTLDVPDQSGYSYKSQCPQVLQPDENCSIVVTWQPTSKGLAQGVLAVQHSGKGGLVQAELRGVFQATGDVAKDEGKVEAAPTSMDFGTSSGGIALVRSLSISNHTLESIKIEDVTLSAPDQAGFSYKSQCPETLPPEGACNVIVTWLPTSKGLAQGVLAVQHSGKGSLVQTELRGIFQTTEQASKSEGKVEVSPESLDYGTSPGGIALVRSIIISNHTTDDVEIRDIKLNVPEKSGFSYESQCPKSLHPEESCNIIMTWLPTTKGLAQGVLVVQHSGKTGMGQVELKGILQSAETASQPGKDMAGKIEVSPDSLDFGTSAGGIPLVRSLILTNRSSEKVDIKGIGLDMPEQSGFSYKSECPQTLQPDKSCNVVVTWLPTSKGVAQGILLVQHTAANGLTQVDIKGTLQPESGKSATVYPEVTPDQGLLVADKEAVDFGTGIKEESAITITLVNAGKSDLTIKGIRLSLKNNDMMVANSGCKEGVILKPVEACPLTISWFPSHGGAILDSLQILHTGTRGVLVIPVHGAAEGGTESGGTTAGGSSSSSGSSIAGGGSVIMDMNAGSGKSSGTAEGGGRESSRSAGSGMKQALDGYTVTSHSSSRAVINGPAGGLVVRDGEDAVIAGIKCTVTIVPTGVVLSSGKDKVMLLFDRSLKLIDQATSGVSSNETGASGASATTSSAAPAAALLPPNLMSGTSGH